MQTDAEALLQDIAELTRDLQEASRKLHELTIRAVRLAKTETVADAWVRAHGEMVTKRAAAEMMGCSDDTVYRLIRAGDIATAPNGMVLVRSCAEYANTPSGVRRRTA